MRLVVLVVALGLSLPLCAQEKEKPQKPAMKKGAAMPKGAHQQASKEQVRKFNELQKKQQKAK